MANIAQFDCPECGASYPLDHSVGSTCGGAVSRELNCYRCDAHISYFRCSECGYRPSASECLSGPTSPPRRERAQAARDEEAEREREAEAERQREAEEERQREYESERNTNRASDTPTDASSGDTKGCRAIPGALGATVITGGLLALFVTLFGGGNWGYSGWCCCSVVGFAMLATLGAWQSVFK